MNRSGTVKWFNESRGYGFIAQSSGPDIYVHHSAIEMEGYRTLTPGMQVEFELSDETQIPTARRVNPAGGALRVRTG